MARKKERDPRWDKWWEISLKTHKPVETPEFQTAKANWQALWDGVLAEANAAEISLLGALATTGWSIAMNEGSPRKALDFLETYLRHPAYGQESYTCQISMREMAALCHYLLDERDKAMEMLYSDLARTVPKERRSAIIHARSFVLRHLKIRRRMSWLIHDSPIW